MEKKWTWKIQRYPTALKPSRDAKEYRGGKEEVVEEALEKEMGEGEGEVEGGGGGGGVDERGGASFKLIDLNSDRLRIGRFNIAIIIMLSQTSDQ